MKREPISKTALFDFIIPEPPNTSRKGFRGVEGTAPAPRSGAPAALRRQKEKAAGRKQPQHHPGCCCSHRLPLLGCPGTGLILSAPQRKGWGRRVSGRARPCCSAEGWLERRGPQPALPAAPQEAQSLKTPVCKTHPLIFQLHDPSPASLHPADFQSPGVPPDRQLQGGDLRRQLLPKKPPKMPDPADGSCEHPEKRRRALKVGRSRLPAPSRRTQPEEGVKPSSCSMGLYLHSSASSSSTSPASFSIRATC